MTEQQKELTNKGAELRKLREEIFALEVEEFESTVLPKLQEQVGNVHVTATHTPAPRPRSTTGGRTARSSLSAKRARSFCSM